MPETTPEYRPGFQGSETSWVEVIFYRHADDPVILGGGGEFPVSGPRIDPVAPKLLSVSTQKALGTPSGAWTVQLKPSKAADLLLTQLVDDDWVDIVFYRHNQPWHTMRGLIDDIRRSKAVAGSGATSEVFTVTGRDFGKIWEITPVWFSPYADNDLVTEAVAHQVFDAMVSVVGSPPNAVRGYLRGFLESLESEAGVDWTPPIGMPGIKDGNFLDNITFTDNYYQNKPARKAFNPGFMAPQGTLWSLAQQYSDPMFTELYVDLLPNGNPFSSFFESGYPLNPTNTEMTVVIRDKPFPVSKDVDDFEDAAGFPLSYTSWWDQVPVFIVPTQQIVFSDLGRSGLERFNTFYMASLLHQEQTGQGILNIITPLVELEQIKRHGMRRMDVQSQMAPDGLDFGIFSQQQRTIIRDWYCLNPYMISGTINLGLGRPDVKIGCRVRVPGALTEHSDESYYVEQVSHNWTFGRGTRTSLGVTRGWIGTDDSYLDKLNEAAAGYQIPQLRRNVT